ncbi:ciliary neurotrophic factor receptor subunit alpha-like [Sinocyclocheilus anshuiensis]|uniref:ciliary neurotrophic factor receptor subunit alpha-like n=1 Tax=Sinocyclocheilus anshuiensis TaxID=1608454 RepID=UPI0007B8B8B8|nr:PREDICTED: ciliary neurotrophic factor receptor subunit alpha-like [Sinocyclocheilus anshuiensis]
MEMRKEKAALSSQQGLNHSPFHTQEHMRRVPPKEPQVTCRSNTYPKGFYCSWHLQHPTYIPTDFEVYVQHNQRPLEVTRDEVHKNRCHVKFPELFSSFPYRVNVTAVNSLGRASIVFLLVVHYHLHRGLFGPTVKPDPPEKVVAKPVANNARRLEVTWNSPSTWPDVETFPLKYFLRYRPLIRDQWQHVELSDSISHTITDAYAGKEYIIQLAAKDMEIGTWSDWSVAVHSTPWMEEPKPITSTTESDIIPETTPGPPSAAPRVGEPTAACSTLLWSTHLLLACVLLSIM